MAPEPNNRVPFGHWLMVGGMGLPPTKTKLLQMSSERKAAHREEKGYAEEKKRALAEFEEQWGPVSPGLGFDQRRKPGRAELMATYGPGGSKRNKATAPPVADDVDDKDDKDGAGDGDGDGDGDSDGNGNGDGIASSVASVAGSDGARAAADGDGDGDD